MQGAVWLVVSRIKVTGSVGVRVSFCISVWVSLMIPQTPVIFCILQVVDVLHSACLAR